MQSKYVLKKKERKKNYFINPTGDILVNKGSNIFKSILIQHSRAICAFKEFLIASH